MSYSERWQNNDIEELFWSILALSWKLKTKKSHSNHLAIDNWLRSNAEPSVSKEEKCNSMFILPSLFPS